MYLMTELCNPLEVCPPLGLARRRHHRALDGLALRQLPFFYPFICADKKEVGRQQQRIKNRMRLS